ncbi:fluoride efflux transporter CrcB [Marinobacter sp. M3C]|jgi:CrcB protein|uniref:fluoride efflux transporter CrcB n=1 Tax=unclassified Marinobacter TaxID=83889 RepID=UPI002010652A|nr:MULTISPECIES: fluoride efflux transporter CrcB [unclassified Marinobacter]MCL1478135.1 fluoride efflux transporter CrcB [Marinobacter sp.]MCL1480090.1 fluoride efflux transporter CrcB [Marinobacter sp.]MCL1484031.1 fluoride efflux transporter CrcB [Marinobacter sp.]MCL1486874.1 fluoride efflux transporter CrcB [Marinobacter sp.]UQG58291.1 fluoride efflux transporter CrcB [Marinobacter sp. M4C]
MWLSVLAISGGAVLGANLRWALGLWLNASHHHVPLGTLVANMAGGWLAGLLLAWFSHSSSLSPEWRLFAITGLCGALTTFSTFSLEMLTAMQQGKWGMALVGILAHVCGALLMTAVGFYTVALIKT